MLPIVCIALLLHLGNAIGGACVSSSGPWYRRVAPIVCCDMGWISAQWGVPCNWSVAKKTGSMYIRRRWSLWTLAVTFLAWHSSCHTSQLVFLQSHQCHPTTSSFQSHKDLKEYNKPSVRWKSLAFYKLKCGDIFRWAGQVGLQFVFFWDNINNHKYVWILLLKITFRFPKVKWLHLKDEVDKPVRFSCQVLSGFNLPEIIKIG